MVNGRTQDSICQFYAGFRLFPFPSLRPPIAYKDASSMYDVKLTIKLIF